MKYGPDNQDAFNGCIGICPLAPSERPWGEDGTITPDSLFEGVMIQQMVLKRDQQLGEWAP